MFRRLGEWSEAQLLMLECTVVDRIGALNGTSARRCRRLCSGAAVVASECEAESSGTNKGGGYPPGCGQFMLGRCMVLPETRGEIALITVDG